MVLNIKIGIFAYTGAGIGNDGESSATVRYILILAAVVREQRRGD